MQIRRYTLGLFIAVVVLATPRISCVQSRKTKGQEADSSNIPMAVETCNGLTISLNASHQKCPVGTRYALNATLTNCTGKEIVVWVPRNRIDLLITESNRDGRTVSYFMPSVVGFHDFGVWQADIVDLAPGNSKIVIYHFCRNMPGTLRYVSRYINHRKAVTPERGDDEVEIWTGKLVSRPVTIDFFEK